MSELKSYVMPSEPNILGQILGQTIVGQSYYLKSEVDKVIAEKDAKILALEAEVFKQKHHAELFLDERNYAETQLSHANHKLEEQESLVKDMKEAAADMGLNWHEYDAGEDAWEDHHKGKWVKAESK